MPRLTFHSWLGRVKQPGPIKNFALDWYLRGLRPRTMVTTLPGLIERLRQLGATNEQIEGARAAWAAWQGEGGKPPVNGGGWKATGSWSLDDARSTIAASREQRLARRRRRPRKAAK